MHSIEHGAAAFLYDPCADQKEIDAFKSLAKSCLRRHIITPYKNLPKNETFSVATFSCRLKLNKVIGMEDKIVSYLRAHAIKDGPEYKSLEDGKYVFNLIEKSKIVSDKNDTIICPSYTKQP